MSLDGAYKKVFGAILHLEKIHKNGGNHQNVYFLYSNKKSNVWFSQIELLKDFKCICTIVHNHFYDKMWLATFQYICFVTFVNRFIKLKKVQCLEQPNTLLSYKQLQKYLEHREIWYKQKFPNKLNCDKHISITFTWICDLHKNLSLKKALVSITNCCV